MAIAGQAMTGQEWCGWQVAGVVVLVIVTHLVGGPSVEAVVVGSVVGGPSVESVAVGSVVGGPSVEAVAVGHWVTVV